MTKLDEVASLPARQYHHAYKGPFVWSEDIQTYRDFKEQAMSQIISYYLVLQLCSFLLIPFLCHGQGEEGPSCCRAKL